MPLDDDGVETAPVRVCLLTSSTPGEMGWPAIRAALARVINLHPGREFVAPVVFPEVFGEKIFAPLGFLPQPISQFLMRRDLAAGAPPSFR